MFENRKRGTYWNREVWSEKLGLVFYRKKRNVDNGWSESPVVTLSETSESENLHMRYVEEMLIGVTAQSVGGIPPVGVGVEEASPDVCGSAADGKRRMWRRR
ncbi:hypothetical protein L2E82_13345 [Cichorium intybus]|uniref:Uncharacterized protein n=1 Tax=Cichorium intybus TaxID=13427 RepID=A0ACB9EYG6_CICIN|nr:hypothetical protein L2E82_13345 [Cichorium intybus]